MWTSDDESPLDSCGVGGSDGPPKYLPSYLVYAEHEGEVFHIQIATDVAGDRVIIVTAYRPTPEKWEADLKTRRRS